MIDLLLVLVGVVVNTLLLAVLLRRLLGVPVGWPRTVGLSLLLWLIGDPVVRFIAEQAGWSPAPAPTASEAVPMLVLLGLLVAWGVVVGLVLLVIAEALVPTGSLPSPWRWLRDAPARHRRGRRYLQIIRIAARHGLGAYLRPRPVTTDQPTSQVARSLRAALAEAGVTFVKLGQMLGARPDLIGPTFAGELSRLQSDAPPEPWPSIETTLEAELGRPWREVFADVETAPLAAASVAQVHRARRLDGRAVVLKVQRGQAARQVAADTDILLRLTRWLARTTPWGRTLRVDRLAEGFVASLAEELDYRVEAQNTRAVAATLDADGRIRAPQVHDDLGTARLLVMDEVAGPPLSRAGAELAALGEEARADLARHLLTVTLQQMLLAGVFHADLHPGNVILGRETAGPVLTLLDLGSVGRLDRAARQGLARLLDAVDRDDAVAATDALLDVLDPPLDLDDRRFERELGELLTRLDGDTGAAMGVYTALLALVFGHGFAVPAQVAAALRCLGTVEGTLGVLSPGLRLVPEARAVGAGLRERATDPQTVKESLTDQLTQLLPTLQRLPRRVASISRRLDEGSLSVRVSVLSDPGDRRFVTDLVRQLVVAVLAAAASLGGVLLLATDHGPVLVPGLTWLNTAGLTVLLLGFVLAARVLAFAFTRTPGSS